VAEDIPVRQFSNRRCNYCANVCKSVTRNGVHNIISSAFHQSIFISKIKCAACHSESQAGTVLTEKTGAFGNTFLQCLWELVPRMHTSRQLHLLCWVLRGRQQQGLHSARPGWVSPRSGKAQQRAAVQHREGCTAQGESKDRE